MAKIIFLDINGVIDDNDYQVAPDFRISKDKISILNRIIQATDAQCVLSSDWRYTFSCGRMQSHLRNNFGFIGKIIACTPKNNQSRLQQITSWYDDYCQVISDDDISDFIILDDLDIFNLVDKSTSQHTRDLASKHMFRTDAWTGLTDDIANKIITRLNNDVI